MDATAVVIGGVILAWAGFFAYTWRQGRLDDDESYWVDEATRPDASWFTQEDRAPAQERLAPVVSSVRGLIDRLANAPRMVRGITLLAHLVLIPGYIVLAGLGVVSGAVPVLGVIATAAAGWWLMAIDDLPDAYYLDGGHEWEGAELAGVAIPGGARAASAARAMRAMQAGPALAGAEVAEAAEAVVEKPRSKARFYDFAALDAAGTAPQARSAGSVPRPTYLMKATATQSGVRRAPIGEPVAGFAGPSVGSIPATDGDLIDPGLRASATG